VVPAAAVQVAVGVLAAVGARAARSDSSPVVTHIVLFTPKPSLDSASLRSFAQLIQASLRQIPGVRRAYIGKAIDVSPAYERILGDKTYKYAALLEFDDAAALEAYLNHPLHRELGRLFWANCGSTVIHEAAMTDVLKDDLVI
jgi:hypothetical protein